MVAHPIGEFTKNEGMFTHTKSDFQIDLKSSLQDAIAFGGFFLIAAFSNWHSDYLLKVKKGYISRVETDLNDSMSLFAVDIPTAKIGKNSTHFFPWILYQDHNSFLIGTTSHDIEGNIDSDLELIVRAYAYQSENCAWKAIFYEGLQDYTAKRWDFSIFKLATSIELYSDYVFKGYLEKNGISEELQTEIIDYSKWETKLKRIKALSLRTKNPLTAQLIRKYKDDVISLRNDFVHRGAKCANEKKATIAYLSAFDILWCLDCLTKEFNLIDIS